LLEIQQPKRAKASPTKIFFTFIIFDFTKLLLTKWLEINNIKEQISYKYKQP